MTLRQFCHWKICLNMVMTDRTSILRIPVQVAGCLASEGISFFPVNVHCVHRLREGCRKSCNFLNLKYSEFPEPCKFLVLPESYESPSRKKCFNLRGIIAQHPTFSSYSYILRVSWKFPGALKGVVQKFNYFLPSVTEYLSIEPLCHSDSHFLSRVWPLYESLW